MDEFNKYFDKLISEEKVIEEVKEVKKTQIYPFPRDEKEFEIKKNMLKKPIFLQVKVEDKDQLTWFNWKLNELENNGVLKIKERGKYKQSRAKVGRYKFYEDIWIWIPFESIEKLAEVENIFDSSLVVRQQKMMKNEERDSNI